MPATLPDFVLDRQNLAKADAATSVVLTAAHDERIAGWSAACAVMGLSATRSAPVSDSIRLRSLGDENGGAIASDSQGLPTGTRSAEALS